MIRFTLLLLASLLTFSSSSIAMQHGGNSNAGSGKNKEACVIASLKCAKAPSASFGPDGKLWLCLVILQW